MMLAVVLDMPPERAFHIWNNMEPSQYTNMENMEWPGNLYHFISMKSDLVPLRSLPAGGAAKPLPS
jgi:hypothetical protein